MTIDELAGISNVKVKTVRNNIKAVAGVTIENGEAIIPAGTRYPFDAHRYKFSDIGKRQAALLDATFRCQYIDYKMLKMEEPAFKSMIQELVTAQLLRDNGSNNPYGANSYDTTLKYTEFHNERINNRIKMIQKALEAAAGLVR